MDAERRDATIQPKSSLVLDERKRLEIHGVTDVIRFDEDSAAFTTTCGSMTVEGERLHVLVLNLEQSVVVIDGRIDSILYFDREDSEKTEKGGFFGRLFH